MEFISVFWLVVAVIVLGVLGYFISCYNNYVQLRNNIRKSFKNIDVLLKQRYDEVPNLVAVCKGYIQHESGVFTKIAMIRSKYNDAKDIDKRTGVENELTGQISSLFATVENYPQLKADTQYLFLQNKLHELESAIADRREYFNDSVNIYNVSIERFPDRIIALILGLKRHSFLSIPENEKKPLSAVFAEKR